MARDAFLGQEGQGSKYNDYTFEVTDSIFATSEKYMNGEVYMLHWAGLSSVEGDEIMVFEEGYHPSFTMSSDWVSLDGGKTIQYQGRSAKPKLGRNYGRMLNKVAEITEGMTPDPLDSINPHDASSWIGTKWRLEREEVDFGGRIGKQEIELPVEYLGRSTGQAQAPVAPVTASPVAPAPSVAPAPAPAPAPAAANGALRSQVVTLAQNLGTFEEFRAAALQVPGVLADQGLIAEIVDQANGIFATKA